MALEVEYTEGFDPIDVAFTLELQEPLSKDQQDRLSNLLGSWYVVGSTCGFGEPLHYMSDVGYHDDGVPPTVEWIVDMGRAGQPAMDVLIRALECFAEIEKVRPHRLLLGWRRE